MLDERCFSAHLGSVEASLSHRGGEPTALAVLLQDRPIERVHAAVNHDERRARFGAWRAQPSIPRATGRSRSWSRLAADGPLTRTAFDERLLLSGGVGSVGRCDPQHGAADD